MFRGFIYRNICIGDIFKQLNGDKKMIIIPKRENIKIGLELAKKGVKDALKDENTVTGQVKRLVDDIKETREIGSVYTTGITDNVAKAELDKVADGISAYAKANKLNIIFHTPMEREYGFKQNEKVIGVSAYSNGLFNAYTDMTFINGDTNAITQFKGEKLTADDSFTRRAFRAVEQMTDSINKQRKSDYDNSFIGVFDKTFKEKTQKIAKDSKNIFNKSTEAVKKAVKKYIKKKIKFIKDEFTGKGSEY